MNNDICLSEKETKDLIRDAELIEGSDIHVAGRYWSSMDVRRLLCAEGKTLSEIMDYAVCRYFFTTTGKYPTEFQKNVWIERCRVRIDGVEIPKDLWSETKPQKGSFVEFFIAPGKGGGGGKNILTAVIMVVVIVVVTIVTWGSGTAPTAGAMGGTASMAESGAAAATAAAGGSAAASSGGFLSAVGSAAAKLALCTAGTFALSKICPTTASPQAQKSAQAAESSPTYSISGSSGNAINAMGYVPLVLGKYRFAGPLAAKSWTEQIGDDQYFNMCVVWGHPNMGVSDFRIGETPLSNFNNVTHVFHGSTTGNDLQYFNRSHNQVSVGAVLKYNNPVTRNVGECDSIGITIYYPALANSKSGDLKAVDVKYLIEYAQVGTNTWYRMSAEDKFYTWPQYVDTYTGAGLGDLWCARNGVWGTWLNNTHADGHADGVPAFDSHWSVFPIAWYKDKHKHHEWRTKEAWYDAGVTDVIHNTAATASPKTFAYEWAVPHGEWQVRITRISPDTDDVAIYDDGTWSTISAILNKPVFNTPIPICVSELHIKASEQLSGYVSDFNALCHSIFPIWDKTNKKWNDEEYEYTQNPAAIYRYLMLSRHALNSPYTTNKLDEARLGEFYEWCEKKDFHFDFVCDSESAAWARWTSVVSAGRGAVTADNDGLFGVMIDNDEKVPVQMFTPRNSWGFSIERTFYTLPHALRVAYSDETDGYTNKEGFVYADGYNKDNATNIIEWSFTGKTRWADVYKMGRYYLASIKLRPITITLSTDWEWLMCRRGDVVAVSHDVLMNTFGTARVVALIYKDTDSDEYIYIADEANKPTDGTQPVGVMLDDTVLFSQDKQFGIAIRNTNGKVITYGIVSELNKETNEMIFTNAITAAQCPYIGALASVSIFGQETANYLVASIAMSSNDNSAELTLVPWSMPEILESESGTIPDWDPPIVLPQIGSAHNLPAPSIRDIKSDETMLKRSGNSLVVCMGIWWNLPQKIGSDTGRLSVQAKILKQSSTPDTTNESTYAIADSTTAAFVLYEGVEEKATYRVWIRLVSEFGIVSPWSDFVDHTVVGRTTLPTTPEGLTVSLNPPVGVKSKWQPNSELDVNQYKVVYSGEGLDDIEVLTPNTEANIAVTKWVGKLNVSLYAIDDLKLLSAEPTTASIMLYKPDTPVITSSLLSSTFILQWQDCATTWPIKYYVVHDKWTGHDTTFNAADEWTSIAARPTNADYDFDIYAHDIFDNIGDTGTVKVHIPDIVAPDTFDLSLDKEELVMKWSGAVSAFDIDYYELMDVVYNPVAHVKGTTYKLLVTEKGTKEYRLRVVDVAGNVSAWVEGSIEITEPDTPPDMEAYIVDSQVRVSWGDPYAVSTDPSKLPIVSYQLIRQWDKEIEPGLVETLEEDYGTYDALDAYVAPLKYGNHTFMVRAIDSGGNIGGWASVDISIRNPGKVTFYNCAAIDNNTMLYWTAPEPTSFPIAYYILYDVDEDGYESERGRVDGLFSAQIEHTSGSYIYRVKAADVADNIGEPSDITIIVSQPPDFIFYHDYDSLFNGDKTNIVLSGDGYMLGPVVEGETWTENITRTVAKINDSSITADNLAWDTKSNKGHQYYLSPFTAATSTYIETLDVGTPVPSSRIQITITKKALEGNPVITCKIETSADNETWITLSDNATTVFGTSFQYIRVTLNWSGGLLEIDNINITLDVKRKRDNGTAMLYKKDCYAADGVTLLPEDEIGTFVPFNDSFIDIEGDIAVAPVSEDTGHNPIVVFKDVPYPTGFKGIMLDKYGKPMDGEITWSVRGV